jgi:hypothetical protein
MILDIYEQEFKGLSKIEAEEYAKLVLRAELTTEEYNNAITTLIQFPLFAPGLEPGIITFKHELIGEYLAGRYFLRRLVKDPVLVARSLGKRTDFADSLIARYVASQLDQLQGGIEAIVKTLKSGAIHGRAFANFFQLILLSSNNRDVVKANDINLEGRDLSHVQFVYKDLKGVSFRNCNLSNTIFRSCDLREALFEGALLSGTRFEHLSEKELAGARFGDLGQFEFIFWDRTSIDDFKSMIEWVRKTTGRIESIAEPCPTALQLRRLFLKYVYPDGTGRRDELSEAALIKGKRYQGAPSLEDCVKSCIRFGYLQALDWRKRIKRTPGDKYNDIVYFVKEWRVKTELRQLLNSLCPDAGCMHVPESVIS